MNMWVTRMRVWFKSVLLRDSFLYRVFRTAYRAFTSVCALMLTAKQIPREISDNSIFLLEEELPMCSIFPKEILDLTIELFHPQSVLDVGCGTGISLDYFKSKGLKVHGIEGSELAISKARNPDLISTGDLNTPIHLDEEFDLVWCFEVAEHIHPKYVGELLGTLTSHGNRILLSAARPGQGGLGHLNEQPAEYWIQKMEERGFACDQEGSSKYRSLPDHFAANILIFDRRLKAVDLA